MQISEQMHLSDAKGGIKKLSFYPLAYTQSTSYNFNRNWQYFTIVNDVHCPVTDKYEVQFDGDSRV